MDSQQPASSSDTVPGLEVQETRRPLPTRLLGPLSFLKWQKEVRRTPLEQERWEFRRQIEHDWKKAIGFQPR